MPKLNRGKTKTIKKRAIYVYLPSEKMVEDWKNSADEAGVSISKFVMERVEDSVRKEEGEEGYLSRLELIKKLSSSEEELKKLRAELFLQDGFRGTRRIDQELIDLLRKGGSLSGEEILNQLSINPSDSELVKAVNTQLE